jgi:hypothetical protein
MLPSYHHAAKSHQQRYMHCCHTFGSSMGLTLSQWNVKPLSQTNYLATHLSQRMKDHSMLFCIHIHMKVKYSLDS